MSNVRTGVYVISLDSSTERRAAFTEMSVTSELDWTFLSAFRGLDAPLVYDERLAIQRFGRPLSQAEIGTYTSHFKAWDRFLNSNFDQIIILEDDVVVDWPLVNLLGRFKFEDSGIDFLRLFATHPFSHVTAVLRFCSPHSHLLRCTGLMLGIQAYLLTRKAAEALLATGNRIFEPVDWVMSRYWRYEVPNYCLFPFPVLERFVPSTIGSSRENFHRVTKAQWISSWIWRIENRISREFADRVRFRSNHFPHGNDIGLSYLEKESLKIEAAGKRKAE